MAHAGIKQNLLECQKTFPPQTELRYQRSFACIDFSRCVSVSMALSAEVSRVVQVDPAIAALRQIADIVDRYNGRLE